LVQYPTFRMSFPRAQLSPNIWLRNGGFSNVDDKFFRTADDDSGSCMVINLPLEAEMLGRKDRRRSPQGARVAPMNDYSHMNVVTGTPKDWTSSAPLTMLRSCVLESARDRDRQKNQWSPPPSKMAPAHLGESGYRVSTGRSLKSTPASVIKMTPSQSMKEVYLQAAMRQTTQAVPYARQDTLSAHNMAGRHHDSDSHDWDSTLRYAGKRISTEREQPTSAALYSKQPLHTVCHSGSPRLRPSASLYQGPPRPNDFGSTQAAPPTSDQSCSPRAKRSQTRPAMGTQPSRSPSVTRPAMGRSRSAASHFGYVEIRDCQGNLLLGPK